ncbi:MAG: ABC transporter ATP-binding protein [Elusimicrobiota bacterium]|nr:ABC transporter ATP-binding protein [Elusimicrobiota bacterium]
MLSISKLNVRYGHIEALRDIDIEADEGEIYSIIGSNGAGKTSLLKAVSGLVKPQSGVIKFNGEVLSSKPYKIVEKGIVHVPEGRKTFSGLTIKDNLLIGGYLSSGKDLNERLEKQYKLFPILKDRSAQHAGTLSGGEQQMLAISRGLMGNPKMILLDEPSLGLAPIIVNQIYDLIKQIRESGITVFLVEQNARKALSICDKACVLENGRIVLRGNGQELLKSEQVKKAYLGG